ncbi:PIG-L deacetylase family protein [Limimaricola pyoseonensis]|uniref:N-acetylglucosaminyl deacetylase, LmbE family n=1 Tax=Limimaricola pyoseonensis TaxID=521013 RepID=A0A1G7IZZ3_9RHOB|nr:PIG-L family deacetylase [Limimaricola pyoseonensis]SDF18183.1 N-acetylglucosaminyl deacetylase, LmbE family [Limimaricola pyoseonensis]
MTETAQPPVQPPAQPSAQPPALDRLRRRFWAGAERGACRLFHAALALRARDATAQAALRPALVLAPHADDESLGCGGIIALKRAAGTRVEVLVATDGTASHRAEPTRRTGPDALAALRRAETQAACATLGLAPERLGFLGLPDGRLAEHEPRLAAAIRARLAAARPDEVYVCALRDGHPDHAALARAARTALSGPAGQGIALREYPVWSFDFRSWRRPGRNSTGFLLGLRDMARAAAGWRMAAVRLGPARQVKAEALAQHRSQLGTYPAEPGWSGLPSHFLAHFAGRRELFRDVALPERRP